MKNTQWKFFYGSIVAGIVFGAIGFCALTFINGFSGGFALTVLALWALLSSLGTAALFFHRARTMDSLLSGERLLAHWVYSGSDVEKSIEKEYKAFRERNRALLIVIGVLMVVIIIPFIIFGGNEGLWTAVIMLVVFGICAVVSEASPRIERYRAQHASKEAYIAQNGVIYEGSVYPFLSFFVKKNAVGYQEGTKRRPALLVFSFFQLILWIPRPFDVAIPVPRGQEDKAREIVRMLGGHIPGS